MASQIVPKIVRANVVGIKWRFVYDKCANQFESYLNKLQWNSCASNNGDALSTRGRNMGALRTFLDTKGIVSNNDKNHILPSSLLKQPKTDINSNFKPNFVKPSNLLIPKLVPSSRDRCKDNDIATASGGSGAEKLKYKACLNRRYKSNSSTTIKSQNSWCNINMESSQLYEYNNMHMTTIGTDLGRNILKLLQPKSSCSMEQPKRMMTTNRWGEPNTSYRSLRIIDRDTEDHYLHNSSQRKSEHKTISNNQFDYSQHMDTYRDNHGSSYTARFLNDPRISSSNSSSSNAASKTTDGTVSGGKRSNRGSNNNSKSSNVSNNRAGNAHNNQAATNNHVVSDHQAPRHDNHRSNRYSSSFEFGESEKAHKSTDTNNRDRSIHEPHKQMHRMEDSYSNVTETLRNALLPIDRPMRDRISVNQKHSVNSISTAPKKVESMESQQQQQTQLTNQMPPARGKYYYANEMEKAAYELACQQQRLAISQPLQLEALGTRLAKKYAATPRSSSTSSSNINANPTITSINNAPVANRSSSPTPPSQAKRNHKREVLKKMKNRNTQIERPPTTPIVHEPINIEPTHFRPVPRTSGWHFKFSNISPPDDVPPEKHQQLPQPHKISAMKMMRTLATRRSDTPRLDAEMIYNTNETRNDNKSEEKDGSIENVVKSSDATTQSATSVLVAAAKASAIKTGQYIYELYSNRY